MPPSLQDSIPICLCVLKAPAMDASKLRSLPPAKRFSALQRILDKENARPPSDSPHVPLPTKKRKESRYFDKSVLSESCNTSTYCLPAKKRVWAIQPDSEFPFSSIDLNVTYKPPLHPSPSSIDLNVSYKPPLPPPPPIYHPHNVDDEETGRESKFLCECNKGTHEIARQEVEKTKELDVKGAEDEDDGIVCSICQSTDGDPKDPIVFCDGCDLMVHTSCYGNPLVQGVPEGDWFCHQCLEGSKVEGTRSFSCCLCPKKGGALKSTVDGRWAHVVCALFVPEVFFHDSEGRDMIDCFKVPTRRWGQRCYVCEGRTGCAIDCSEHKCPLSFHVTCGFSEDLCIEYREGKGKGAIIAGFCKAHTNLWEKQQQTGKFRIVAREEEQ